MLLGAKQDMQALESKSINEDVWHKINTLMC